MPSQGRDRDARLIRAIGVLASSNLPDDAWDQLAAARAAGDKTWRERALSNLAHHGTVYLNRVCRYCEGAARREKLVAILRALWVIATETKKSEAAAELEKLGRQLAAREVGPGAAARLLLALMEQRRWDFYDALNASFR